MELYDVMRTTFAAREYTDEPVTDEVLHRIFENARFAPSGGNRQGGKVIVVREAETKRALGQLCVPTLRVYDAQRQAGEAGPWNTIVPTGIDIAEAEQTPTTALPIFEAMADVPVVLIFAVDLRVVASTDKNLDRIGVVSGGSIYPLVWNTMLAARNEGLGGAMTTLISAAEPAVQELLGLESYEAVAALVPLGHPVKQLTKLRRNAVEEFVFHERADGDPLTLD